jgi:hypothetical protein
MTTIHGSTYQAELFWDATGQPVLYVVGYGRVVMPSHVLEVVTQAVAMINESEHDHVCTVYNMLDLIQAPFLVRFVKPGRWPTSPKTAHIIIGTQNPAIRLLGTLAAVSSSARLRTLAVCASQEEVEQAVTRWLALPEQTRKQKIKGF